MKDTKKCQVSGCDLEWTHYILTGIGVVEVCKNHAYYLMEQRGRIMEKQGHPNDFEMFTKEEIDAL